MNPYKFHGQCGRLVMRVIANSLNVNVKDVYKIVKSIDTTYTNSDIVLKNGRKYKLTLKEIK